MIFFKGIKNHSDNDNVYRSSSFSSKFFIKIFKYLTKLRVLDNIFFHNGIVWNVIISKDIKNRSGNVSDETCLGRGPLFDNYLNRARGARYSDKTAVDSSQVIL